MTSRMVRFLFTLAVATAMGEAAVNVQSSAWTWQNPQPQGNGLNSVSCPTVTVCFAVGNLGTILATTNGGSTWTGEASPTTGYGTVGPDEVSRTLSARYYKDGSEILVRQTGKPPRRLTPRECARLMGFDRPGKPPVRIPVSDTQAYKQFGNSVVVPVVEAVARHLQRFIVEATAGRGMESKTKAVA